MHQKIAFPPANVVASLMITWKQCSSGWTGLLRRSAFQTHGTVLTLCHFMSVSLMCRHVNSQTPCEAESLLTDMTSYVSDVEMNRVLVPRQILLHLCAVCASRVVACKRPLVAVHLLLVFCDTSPPRGSKRASRMITGGRSGSPVKPFQMARQIGIRRRGIQTTRLRTFEEVIAMDCLLVSLHVVLLRIAMITGITRKRSRVSVPGLGMHAERMARREDDSFVS